MQTKEFHFCEWTSQTALAQKSSVTSEVTHSLVSSKWTHTITTIQFKEKNKLRFRYGPKISLHIFEIPLFGYQGFASCYIHL